MQSFKLGRGCLNDALYRYFRIKITTNINISDVILIKFSFQKY